MRVARRDRSRSIVAAIVVGVCALMLAPAGSIPGAREGALPSSSATVAATNAPSEPSGISSLLHLPEPALGSGPDRAASLGGAVPHVGSSLSPSLSAATAARSPDPAAPGLSTGPPSLVSPETPGWVSAVTRSIADGQLPASAAFLPSLTLLDDHVTTPSQAVSPVVTVSPAPMGIGDFGLGANGPYTVYTPGVEGTLTLSDYNASGGSLYEDTGSYFYDGSSPNAAASPWQSSVQLNTVVTNISYPGSDQGAFWAQNVVLFSGGTIQLVDNVWNLSSPNATMESGTLLSYGGTLVPGELYYDYGPSFPVEYPMTIELSNDASTLDGRWSTVSFGYTIVEGALPDQRVYSGTYDSVVFHSTPTLLEPLRTPDYQINGSSLAPNNMTLEDAELVFGGPGDGSNAVVASLSGSLSLAYQNGSVWQPAPSAYDYGTDTGETAIGVAGTWSGSTETVTQGPSMLYGLWNTPASRQAQSGALSFTGHLAPTYGFAFIGLNGTPAANLSYAPSDPNGTVATQLPPSIGGVAVYNLTAFADGFSEMNTSFTGSRADFPIDLGSTGDTWNAPIYMNGNSQAQSLVEDTPGRPAPYTFGNLTIDVNLTFNHVNDYGFPEFDLLWANGVTTPLNITNISQGPDSPNGNTSYILDANAPVVNLPDWGDQIAVWSGSDDRFDDLTLRGGYSDLGLEIGGGAVSLWDVEDAFATHVTSLNDSFGIWAADSTGVTVTDSEAFAGGVVLSLLDSSDARATNLSSYSGSADVLEEGGSGGSFVGLNASASSAGLYAFWANDTSLRFVNATDGSLGAELDGGIDGLVADVAATNGSIGVLGDAAIDTEVDDIDSFHGSLYPGVEFVDSSDPTVVDAYANGSSTIGVYLYATGSATVDSLTAVNGSLGLLVNATVGSATVRGVDTSGPETVGVGVVYSSAPVAISDTHATNGSTGTVVEDAREASVSDVAASGANASASAGAVILDSRSVAVANVLASGNLSTGVYVVSSSEVSVDNTTADLGAYGVEVDPSRDVWVNATTATDGSIGVSAVNSTYLWVEGTLADNRSVGVAALSDNWTSANATDADELSLGVAIVDSNYTWVNATTASDLSIGVASESADWLRVDGVTATDPSLKSPWYGLRSSPFGLPIAAVLTELTDQSTVADVNATVYPAGLLDYYSDDLAVESLNATDGDYGILLNGTYESTFSGIVASGDTVGIEMAADASYNLVTESSFVQSAGYGVDIEDGSHNHVYLNDFVGNNGATSVYDASHIQAFSDASTNAFNSSGEIGNYWADWHASTDGVLNPYSVSNGAWDYHPIGSTAGTYVVTFYDAGLASGTSWSVTLSNATFRSTLATVDGWVTFAVAPGTYAFSVAAVTGYAISPSTGSLVVMSGPVDETIDFAALYTVSFTETGLPPATSWAVRLGGEEYSGRVTTIAATVVGGTYAFSIVAPANYSASPSTGSLDISANYDEPIAFSSTYRPPGPVEAVYFNESGLIGPTRWTAVLDGVEESTTLDSLEFNVTAGTYAYQVLPVADYSVSPSSASATVGGSYLVPVTFTLVTYAVTISESGLAPGTAWSAYLNGTFGGSAFSHVVTSSGASMTFSVPNGSWTYSLENVGGYALAHGTGTVLVDGAPAGASVDYTVSTASTHAGPSNLNPDFEIALAIAAVAIGGVVVAVLRSRRAPPPPAAPWSGPAEVPAAGGPPPGSPP